MSTVDAVTVPDLPVVEDVAVQGVQVAEIALIGPQGPPGPSGPFGQMSRTTSGVVTGAAVGTYRTTGLVGTLDAVSDGFVLGTSDQLGLRNASGRTLVMRLYGSADIENGNNHVVGLKLAKNGVAIDATECRSATGQGGVNFAKAVTSWCVTMADGDEVSLFVADFTGTGDLTVQRARLVGTLVKDVTS